jgi:hypothetical protein
MPIFRHVFFIKSVPALISGVFDFLVDLAGGARVVTPTRIATVATTGIIIGEAIPVTATASSSTTTV